MFIDCYNVKSNLKCWNPNSEMAYGQSEKWMPFIKEM